jgi:hypothetical protein
VDIVVLERFGVLGLGKGKRQFFDVCQAIFLGFPQLFLPGCTKSK